jgi:hypothetical protein
MRKETKIMVKGVVIKPAVVKPVGVDKIESSCEVVEIDGSLDSFYKVLDVSTIDIVVRKIGNKYFDIVCDDEGLFHEPVIPSMLTKTGEVMLVGNLFICDHDAAGNTIGLSDEDCLMIKDNSALWIDEQAEQLRSCVLGAY